MIHRKIYTYILYFLILTAIFHLHMKDKTEIIVYLDSLFVYKENLTYPRTNRMTKISTVHTDKLIY